MARRGGLLYVYLHGPHRAASTWVDEYGFVELYSGERGLLIGFKDGANCFYPGTTLQMYRNMDRVQSKGKFVHRHLYGRPYSLV